MARCTSCSWTGDVEALEVNPHAAGAVTANCPECDAPVIADIYTDRLHNISKPTIQCLSDACSWEGDVEEIVVEVSGDFKLNMCPECGYPLGGEITTVEFTR